MTHGTTVPALEDVLPEAHPGHADPAAVRHGGLLLHKKVGPVGDGAGVAEVPLDHPRIGTTLGDRGLGWLLKVVVAVRSATPVGGLPAVQAVVGRRGAGLVLLAQGSLIISNSSLSSGLTGFPGRLSEIFHAAHVHFGIAGNGDGLQD